MEQVEDGEHGVTVGLVLWGGAVGHGVGLMRGVALAVTLPKSGCCFRHVGPVVAARADAKETRARRPGVGRGGREMRLGVGRSLRLRLDVDGRSSDSGVARHEGHSDCSLVLGEEIAQRSRRSPHERRFYNDDCVWAPWLRSRECRDVYVQWHGMGCSG